jgi:hypothetical protein
MAGLPGIQLYFRGGKVVKTMKMVEGLDQEWMDLILEARNLGIEMEMVRNFFMQNGTKELVALSENNQ